MPVTPSKNPLNAFRSVLTTNDFRVPSLPSLNDNIGKRDQFDALAEKWRQDLERQVNERLKLTGDVTNADLETLRSDLTALISGVKMPQAPDLSAIESEISNLASRVTALEIGEQGETPSAADVDVVVLTVTAAEDILTGDPITSIGEVADNSDPAALGTVIGVALNDGSAGQSIRVAECGIATAMSWAWTAGDVLYLNGTTLSTTAPSTGFVQIIGTALDAMRIVVALGAATVTPQVIGDAFADPNGNVTPLFPTGPAFYYQTGAINLWTWNVGSQSWDQLLAPG